MNTEDTSENIFTFNREYLTMPILTERWLQLSELYRIARRSGLQYPGLQT